MATEKFRLTPVSHSESDAMRKLLPAFLVLSAAVLAVLWQKAERRSEAALVRVTQLERLRGNVAAPAPPAGADTPEASLAPPENPVRVPAGAPPADSARPSDSKALDDLTATIAELRRQLAAASEEAQKQSTLVASGAAEQARLGLQVEELKEAVRQSRNTAASLQAELQNRTDRTASSEASQKAVSERLAKAEAAATKMTAVSRELEDLHRRREAQIGTLQRRYREVNDVYRAFLLNEQNREHAGAGNQAGDISRVQNSIQQAEDDLRQIQLLNARIATLIR